MSKNGAYIGERYVRLLHVPKQEMQEQVRLGTVAIPGNPHRRRLQQQHQHQQQHPSQLGGLNMGGSMQRQQQQGQQQQQQQQQQQYAVPLHGAFNMMDQLQLPAGAVLHQQPGVGPMQPRMMEMQGYMQQPMQQQPMQQQSAMQPMQQQQQQHTMQQQQHTMQHQQHTMQQQPMQPISPNGTIMLAPARSGGAGSPVGSMGPPQLLQVGPGGMVAPQLVQMGPGGAAQLAQVLSQEGVPMAVASGPMGCVHARG